MKIERKTVFLCLSIFYPRKKWGILMKAGVSTFLNLPDSRSLICNYILEINNIAGENLRLTLEVKRTNAIIILKSIDVFFTQFLNVELVQPVVKFKISEAKNGFLPFPPYSIQYGLHQFKKTLFFEFNDRVYMQSAFSRLILKKSLKTSLNVFSLVPLACQAIFLAGLRIVKLSGNNSLNTICTYFDYQIDLLGCTTSQRSLLLDAYSENQEYLKQLSVDILISYHGETNKDNSIFIDWDLALNNHIIRYLPKRENAINELLYEYFDIICIQLNFDLWQKLLVSYFVSQMILSNKLTIDR